MPTYDAPAAWLFRVRSRALLRAILRALFRVTELCSYMTEFQCRIRSRIRSRVTQLQCRYRTSRSRMRYVLSGATIVEEGDDRAGFATTLNVSNYRTRNSGTKHHHTHSPMEKAGIGMCTQRSDGKRTYR